MRYSNVGNFATTKQGKRIYIFVKKELWKIESNFLERFESFKNFTEIKNAFVWDFVTTKNVFSSKKLRYFENCKLIFCKEARFLKVSLKCCSPVSVIFSHLKEKKWKFQSKKRFTVKSWSQDSLRKLIFVSLDSYGVILYW